VLLLFSAAPGLTKIISVRVERVSGSTGVRVCGETNKAANDIRARARESAEAGENTTEASSAIGGVEEGAVVVRG
jgi:hypothetical protein